MRRREKLLDWICGALAVALMALLLSAVARDARATVPDAAARVEMAQVLMQQGRVTEAAVILGQLAEERPDLTRVRLDYAAALVALGYYGQADDLFRAARREDLPPRVRRNVERFLERIRARQRFQVDLDFGLYRDNNVNHAPEPETVEIPVFGGLEFELDEQAVESWVARTGLHVRWQHRPLLDGRAYFETRGAVSRNTAINAAEHSRTWVSVSSGPRLHYRAFRRPGLAHASLGAERRWRGGNGYAVSGWARLGAEQTLNHRWRLGAGVRLWQTRYDRLDRDIDPFGQAVNVTLTRRLPLGYVMAQARLSQERTDRQHQTWQGWGASLDYRTALGQHWNLAARATIDEQYYDGRSALFQTQRKDRTWWAGVTVSNRLLALAGYLPELTLGWTQTHSTIPLYDRMSRIIMLGLRRLF